MSQSLSANSQVPVELNKNGTVSKKRLHLGNVPSIPRTEECPTCGAKFTRLNHLKRHLLTHTDLRQHECEKCQFQFHRKDLLTKHMRICGKPKTRTRKSRRKSCTSCAIAKCKCDLQQPCSACKTRNKECFFPTKPSPHSALSMLGIVEPNVVEGFQVVSDPTADSLLISHPSDMTSLVCLPPTRPQLQPLPTATLSNEVTRYVHNGSKSYDFDILSSSFMDAFADIWNSSDNLPPFYPLSLASGNVRAHHPYLGPLSPQQERTTQVCYSSAPRMWRKNENVMFSAPPGTLDLKLCLALCLKHYTSATQVIHSSWTSEEKPSVLLTIMQACGATHIDSPEALYFVRSVANSMPDLLAEEMDVCPPDLFAQLNLLCAFLFLQSECISALQRPSWHLRDPGASLVSMIRRNKLIQTIAMWEHPKMASLTFSIIEEEWKKWILYESFKRILWTIYFSDALQVLFFGTKPSFDTRDFPISLPCDIAAWSAKTSIDWFWIVAGSVESVNQIRFSRHIIVGTIYTVFCSLRQPSAGQDPFNIWHLITSVIAIITELRKALAARTEWLDAFFQDFDSPFNEEPRKIDFLGAWVDVSEIRVMLRNWLDVWRSCPEVNTMDRKDAGNLMCFFDMIYLYYLAHVLLSMYEKPSCEFRWQGPGTIRATKNWLQKTVPDVNRKTVLPWEGISDSRFECLDNEPELQFHPVHVAGMAIYGHK